MKGIIKKPTEFTTYYFIAKQQKQGKLPPTSMKFFTARPDLGAKREKTKIFLENSRFNI